MPIAHQSARVSSGDVEIFYRRLGAPGRAPLLIVHGLSDFTPENAPAGGKRVTQIVGHTTDRDDPHGFLAALRPFLASLEEKSHAR